MMLEFVSDHGEIVGLRGAWNALAERFDNPFLRQECALAVIEAFCRPDQATVAVLRAGTEIRAIAPFRIARHAGLARMEALGRVIYEPTGFLFADDAALDELTTRLLDIRRPLMLGRMAADGPELAALRPKLGQRALLGVDESVDRSVWVPLTAGWERLEAAMSASRRADLRRKQRRAERLGEVAFEAVVPDAGTVDALLHAFCRVEANSWKGRNGTAIVMSPRFERFYTRFCRDMAGQGLLRLFFLRIGERTAAARIAVVQAGRLWEVKIGYDEAFHECSPGVLLTHETLKYACGQGLAGFEFLGKAEPWEFAWTSEARSYASLVLHPLSFSGCLSLSEQACRGLARKSLAALRMDTASRKERARRQSADASAARRALQPTDG